MKREDLKVGEASALEAQALQELIWKAKAEYELKDTLYGNYESYERELAQDAEDIRLCEQLLARLNNNGWISVDERLPEPGNLVLVHVVQDGLNIVIPFASLYAGGFREWKANDCGAFDWFMTAGLVTHWQPLPPPPEQAK